MKKIDLHVHSGFSEHPSEWFLQRLGAKESYTEPEYIYKTAKERGMDFIAITDHNRIDGALRLKQKYPDEVIIGVEATTYFPEDRCKIHILLYGITEEQFTQIQHKRENIYDLREYIREQNIAYSVAHATYSVNNRLTMAHIERLVLLFDMFEGINGGRSALFNEQWMEILKHLTPSHIERLKAKYGIEPISSDPWNKAFTGGSDDHAGLFIGKTYTRVKAETIDEVIAHIKNKKVSAAGRHNDYKALAFTIYKIALDFAKAKNGKGPNSLFFMSSEKLFGLDSFSLKDEIKYSQMRLFKKKCGNRAYSLLAETIDEVKAMDPSHIDQRLDLIFERICKIQDEFFKKVLESVTKDIMDGDLSKAIMNISSSLSGVFLSLPFMSALKHMFQNRDLINEIRSKFKIPAKEIPRKVLWFTDTIGEMNGVAESVKEISWIAYQNKQQVTVVAAEPGDKKMKDLLPPNALYLPIFFTMNLPMYEHIALNFPSVLKSIDLLYKKQPTEIIISTPGPIGLIGLLFAKLFNIKCTGIYHTDFTMQLSQIAGNGLLTEIVEQATRWFYSMMDIIKVPTKEYMYLLEERGFDTSKFQLIKKGIDTDLFSFKDGAKEKISRQYRIKNGTTLLFAGRISKDKNLDLLNQAYRAVLQKKSDINLIIAGEGPYLEELKNKMKDLERVHFTGRLPRTALPEVYSTADIFVFPSTTDTFGLVVMEALACEIPAIVSDIGGPKEIIMAGDTGFIAKNDKPEDWREKIELLIEIKEKEPIFFLKMRKKARQNILSRFDLMASLQSYVSLDSPEKKNLHSAEDLSFSKVVNVR